MGSAFAGLIEALSLKVNTSLEIEDGVKVRVNFDDFALLITYLPGSERVLMAVAVADVPEGGVRLELYRELLRGNFLFGRTYGAALALDPAERFICLQAAQPLLTLTRDNFPDLVENFLSLAGEWRGRCLELSRSAAEEEPAAEQAVAFSAGFEALRV